MLASLRTTVNVSNLERLVNWWNLNLLFCHFTIHRKEANSKKAEGPQGNGWYQRKHQRTKVLQGQHFQTTEIQAVAAWVKYAATIVLNNWIDWELFRLKVSCRFWAHMQGSIDVLCKLFSVWDMRHILDGILNATRWTSSSLHHVHYMYWCSQLLGYFQC